MSDIICTNCGGQSTTGCWLCNPDNFPGANEYADPLDKTYWAKEAGRLSAENAFLTQRLEKLQAEVARLKQEQVDFEYNASCIISTEERRAEAAEAKLAKVLEGMEEIARSSDIEGFGEFIRGQASGWNQCRAQVQAIIKEARDE